MYNLPNDMINVILTFCDQETLNTLQYVNHYFYFKVKPLVKKRLIELWEFLVGDRPAYARCVGKYYASTLDELVDKIINIADAEFHRNIFNWENFAEEHESIFDELELEFHLTNEDIPLLREFIKYLYNEIYKPIDILKIIDEHYYDPYICFLSEGNISLIITKSKVDLHRGKFKW